MKRFTGKVAIVTGGASGIGLATVLRLASEGARVVVADLSGDEASAAADKAQAAGAPGAWGVVCDVSKEPDVAAAVAGTIERFGRLDVVVNNAGRMVFKPLVEHDAADWHAILDVDLLGAFFFTKQAFLHMAAGGSIVNVSSIHARFLNRKSFKVSEPVGQISA